MCFLTGGENIFFGSVDEDDIDYEDFFAVNSKAGSVSGGAVQDDEEEEEEEDEEHINESTAFVSNNYRRFSPAYRQRKNRWSPDLKGKASLHNAFLRT